MGADSCDHLHHITYSATKRSVTTIPGILENVAQLTIVDLSFSVVSRRKCPFSAAFLQSKLVNFCNVSKISALRFTTCYLLKREIDFLHPTFGLY